MLSSVLILAASIGPMPLAFFLRFFLCSVPSSYFSLDPVLSGASNESFLTGLDLT